MSIGVSVRTTKFATRYNGVAARQEIAHNPQLHLIANDKPFIALIR